MTSNNLQSNITVISNDFIDRYLCRADGEYVKVFLMILRLENHGIAATVEEIADRLELTHKDVIRALSYWHKEGLLMQHQETSGDCDAPDPETDRGQSGPASATDPVMPGSIPFKRTLTPVEIEKSTRATDFSRTLFMAETYFGRQFSPAELNSFCYISEQLQFSTELMEYLIEYCVSKGHKSVRYIERVAIEWFRSNVTTVAEAREQNLQYEKNVFPVIRAFGLNGRSLGSSELEYIRRWNSMGFDSELIQAACSKTILSIHQASFPYADKILESWKAKGVSSLKDVEMLDEAFQASRTEHRQGSGVRTSSSGAVFDQRTYDYDALESKLRDTGRRDS